MNLDRFDWVRRSVPVRLVGWLLALLIPLGAIAAIAEKDYGLLDFLLSLALWLTGVGLIRQRRWAYMTAVVYSIWLIGEGLVFYIGGAKYRWVPLVYGVGLGLVFLVLLLVPWMTYRVSSD